MLHIVDRTRVVPKEILKNVLIKVCMFIIPINFVILDYKAYDKVPIILRHLLFTTGGALIDSREEILR